MFILGISENLFGKFFLSLAKKNKPALSASYQIICTFNYISKFRYEELVFYNAVIIFNLHTSFPQNRTSATNSTITRCQDQFGAAAEICMFVMHGKLSVAV